MRRMLGEVANAWEPYQPRGFAFAPNTACGMPSNPNSWFNSHTLTMTQSAVEYTSVRRVGVHTVPCGLIGLMNLAAATSQLRSSFTAAFLYETGSFGTNTLRIVPYSV